MALRDTLSETQLKSPKIDTSGTAKAQQAIADAQTAASALQQNFRADLKTQNIADVNPGATAAEAGASVNTKRKRPQGGLASSLGIDV